MNFIQRVFKAFQIPYSNTTSGLSSTEVQGAIDELSKRTGYISSILGEYKIEAGHTTPPPGTGYIRYNNATQISATEIYINDISETGIDSSIFFSLLTVGARFVIQDKDDHTNIQIFEISSAPIDNTIYWTIPITFLSSNGTGTTGFANNHRVFAAAFNADGSVDEKVKASPTDSTPGTLQDKIYPSAGINTYIIGGAGTNQVLAIENTRNDEYVKVSATDLTTGDLDTKIQVSGQIKKIKLNTPNEYLKLYQSLDTISVNTNTTLTTEQTVNVDTTGGNVIITLPDISTVENGHTIFIKDEGGASWYNTIQANAYGANLIDGQSSATIEYAYGCMILVASGGEWRIYSNHRLYFVNDNSGNESINFYGRVLRTGGLTSLDWANYLTYDSSGVGSLSWDLRTLYNSVGGTVLNWENQKTIDTSNIESIDWNSRLLKTNYGFSSVDWQNQKLLDSSGYTRFDWLLGEMRDGGNVKSIDLTYRQLYTTSGDIFLDYSTTTPKFPVLTTNGIVGTSNGDGTIYINTKMTADGTAAVFGQTMTGIRSNAILLGKSNTQTLGIAGSASGVIVGTSNSDARGASIIVGNSNTVNNSGGTENYNCVLVGYGLTCGNQRAGAFGVNNNVGTGNAAWSFGYGNSHTGGQSVSVGINLSGVPANQMWLGLGSTTKVIIDSSGYVIIGNGVATTGFNLDIYAVTNANALMRIKAPTSSYTAGLVIDSGSITNPYVLFRRGGTDTVQIRSNNNSNFSIYSYRSAPNAESFVIDGVTHNATFTGYILGPAGAVGSPTFSASGDTNTGIFFPVADAIGFVTGGTERARLNASGDLGVGATSTISARIHAISTTEQLRLGYDASNYLSVTVSSAGAVTLDAVGASAGFTFSDSITMSDAKNISFNTTTGTKIGTATTQKISLWNQTPDVQPTNSITAATFVANTSGIVDDSATWGGYSAGQIVAALKRIGALA